MGCLYKLTSPIGKSYIGVSLGAFEDRWLVHLRDALKRKSRLAIHRAIRKYGPDSITKAILAESDDWSELCEMEKRAIATHKTFGRTGYNMTTGGDGVEKMSAAAKARHRTNTSAGTLAKWQDQVFRDRRAAAFARPEVKARQAKATSEVMTRKYKDPKFRQVIKAARAKPEYRARVSASVKKLWQDPAYRESQTLKRRSRTPRTAESKKAQSEKMRALIQQRKANGTYWHEKKAVLA